MADRGPTLGFQRRKRSRGMRTNTSELFRTAHLEEGVLVTADLFPYRTGDVTFAFELSIDDLAAPAGDVLMIGGAVYLSVSISGTDLSFTAGGAGGVTITAAGVLSTVRNYKIVVAVQAGTGEARLWVDGRLMARDGSGGQLASGWADSTSGSYGTGLTDASAVGKLSVFMKQLPRHFNESLYS